LLVLFLAGWIWIAVREAPREQYQKAVREAEQQVPAEVAEGLVEIPPDRPVNVDSWISEEEIARFRAGSGKWLDRAPEDVWVTVEPKLEKFCAAFFASHGHDIRQLTLRLEQRLGLPPDNTKKQFLEIHLDHPTPEVIFRPCLNPAIDRVDCQEPPSGPDIDHRNWLRRQYRDSYEGLPQNSYPWTALGYTFDWAPGPQPGEFQRFGESEFVIRKGAPIQVLQAVDTAEYCGGH
jgi:hypothetical protein